MKKLFTVVLILSTFQTIAQRGTAYNPNPKPIADEPNPITDTFEFKLIDTVNFSKQQLYLKARQFVALQFNDSKSVIQMDDKEDGKIVCKGTMKIIIPDPLGITSTSYVSFTMNIDVRDGKFRCILNNFNHDGFVTTNGLATGGGDLNYQKPGWGNMYGKFWNRIKVQTKKQALQFLADFKLEMETPQKDDNF
jgi:Domain of unknown function (DUF4468) with TBP-like fold